MPVKIRLSRKGRSKTPFYHIVVADSRASRDGKFIEKIGIYNPMTKPATIDIDRNAAYDWLIKGAQPTDTVRAILRFKGVYYKKHLMRGLSKGALTQDQVDTMLSEWINGKESKIQARVEQNKAELEAFRKAVSGDAKKVKKAVADDTSKETAAAIFHASDESQTEPVAEEIVETPAAEETTNGEETSTVDEAVNEEVVTEEEAVTEEKVTEEAETIEEEVVDEAPIAEETPVAEEVSEEVTEAPEVEEVTDTDTEAPEADDTTKDEAEA